MVNQLVRAIAVLLVLAGPAAAGNGFFLGGAADGMRDAEERALERRALEQGGPSAYDRMRQQNQMDELKRLIDENNRLLREQRMDRLINR